jgi:ABC-type uncharacterized transport system permease subunit
LSIVAIASLRRRASGGASQGVLWGLITIGCGALFIYRTLFVYESWQPLAAHVDGLLMLATLFGAAVLFLHSASRLPGSAAFAGPLMVLLLLWAVCASRWTLVAFRIETIVKSVHLATVYLGTLFFAVAAIAGAVFLHSQHRLRHKAAPAGRTPFASLESIERLIIHSSALGLALLTIGLITGLVIVSRQREADPTWWINWKLVLTLTAWLIYAAVMNVRFATAFRGARAAWLSIAGVALLLATFGVSSALPSKKAPAEESAPTINESAVPPTSGGVR